VAEMEGFRMQKVQADFMVMAENGIITNVGRSSIQMPKINFAGGSIKWYKDKPKKAHKQAV